MATETGQPPIDGALGDAGRLGGRHHRPPLNNNSIDNATPADRTERRVSVNLHLGLLVLVVSQLPASRQARMTTDKRT